MECSKCHKCMHKSNFSYKNEKQKIYYLYCDKCRERVNNDDKKIKEKDQYNLIKTTNKVKCECGVTYISFRDYHTIRHFNSVRHKKGMGM